MSKSDEYRRDLSSLSDWEPYLLAHSGLPGPRGNLELAQVVADTAGDAQLARWRALTPQQAPVNSSEEFLVFCGVLGLSRTLVGGAAAPALPELRTFAADPRWRTREAAAMALQRWGDADMHSLLREMQDWAASDDPLVQRAAVAALCEPRLLRAPEHAAAVLAILDAVTRGLSESSLPSRKSDAFRTLRQALGYCWSVAVVSHPETGVPLMEKWLASSDPDIRWIMRENLKKNRLHRTAPTWAASWLAQTAR